MPVRNLMRNRTFCEGDNLEFLLRMPDESVDLIATDPPFNKNREFQGIGKAEGAKFKDYWAWDDDDVHPAYHRHVQQHWPALGEVIEAAYAAHSPSMAAFLAFMSVRLIEMHRILKPTGSIYVHCDHSANAYLRLMMDSIFGKGEQAGEPGFRNEIVWHYPDNFQGNVNRFASNSDTILFYTRQGRGYTFNHVHIPLDKPKKRGGRVWDKEAGRVVALHDAQGKPVYQTYTTKKVDNVWTIGQSSVTNKGKERIGWPTQKPLALYRRIIEASSNPGDLVLDPFAGCATTCVAAEQLGRHWVGIDLSPKAKGITMDRLKKEAGQGTLWENKVRRLTTADLRPLPKGITAALAVPQLPERMQRGLPRGYKPENVRRFIASRDAAGMAKTELGNISCQGCGYTPPRVDYQEVDHITPQAKAGSNIWSNFCLLCPPCNKRKAHRLDIEQLRTEIRAEGLMIDAARLVPMDAASIAKRDRTVRPLQ